jgi:hypothetical protein
MRASTRADKTRYIACFEYGRAQSLPTLLLFSLCLAAVSFYRGIAIAFPNRHLPINNH